MCVFNSFKQVLKHKCIRINLKMMLTINIKTVLTTKTKKKKLK